MAARIAAIPARREGFTLVELMLTVAILAILATIALGSYSRYLDRTKVYKATNDINGLSAQIAHYALDNLGRYPNSLADIGQASMKDPWGHPYQYLSHDPQGHSPPGKWRKDHNIVPINSDFDLWSNGADGKSSPPLTAKPSRDDIVRANNGRFVGLASDFDP